MCQFTFPLNERLEKDFHGYWFREEDISSSIPVATTNKFIKVDERTSGRFNIFGNLSECDCSFRIDDAFVEDTGRYYFRLEGGLVHNYREHQASITIRNFSMQPKFSISIPIPDMLEPDVTVTINCTALERCAGTAPIITWKGDLTTRSPCHDRHTVDYANVSAVVSDEVGMCVVIMCQFTFPLNVTLGKVFHGYWFREGDSSQGNPVASTNISTKVDERTSGRFNIIGNISKCDCTLRIDDAMKEDTGRYYFRFEGGYMHSYVSQPASVTIRDFTNEPEFSIQIPEMLEPDVTLTINCTAPGRCSGTTPIITWIKALTIADSTTNTTSSYNDGTFSYSSSFTFTTSTFDHRKNLTCLVYYPGVKMSIEKTITLNVKSSPCHDRHTVDYANVSAAVSDEVGMCVVIMCQFTFPLNVTLGKVFHGYWFREGDSSQGNPVASTNISTKVDERTSGRFNIIGNISKCDCTLRIDDAMKEDTGRYYFRFEGGYMHSYVSQPASVTIRDFTNEPEFSIQIPEMLEPDVTLTINCTAPGRCSGTTPIITWIKALTIADSTTNTTSSYNDGTFSYSSSFTFTTSTFDHRKNLTCLVYYPGVKMSTEKTVTLNVKSSPCHDRHTVFYVNVSAPVADEEGMCVVIMCFSKQPEFSIPEMLEADVPVMFNCTAPGRCAGTAPIITWTGALTTPNSTTNTTSSYYDGTFSYSSSFTFTTSTDDHRKNLTCLVYYPGVKMSTEKTVTLNVKSSPCHDRHTIFYVNVSTPVADEVGFSKQPEFSIPEMLEADVPVMFNCTAPGRCAGTAPIITWTEALTTPNSTTNTTSSYYDGTFSYSSSFTFTTSTDDHRKNLTCLVYYPGVKMSTEKTVTLNVKSK
ncbi:uncharacterized protein LOC115075631 [Rhinatrema bivittatum]|uniref:uncharacterized protein LOC115075631 n=2 Tax=Rhinatrema bivittatum TaxID=194408 RepID=UPI00112D5721|nr:uncharacterized protein LOC115075631 [Rhinatrema bivittatum]